MTDTETLWNMGMRYVHLPFLLKDALDGAVNEWDMRWWLRQRRLIPRWGIGLWNSDAVGDWMFTETFIDPMRHLLPDVAWFDADQRMV